jgi:nucleoside-diphosphate-sugar epimerase
MRILVAGATGAIGLELLPQLIAAGHSVVGTTRTAAKAEIIKRMGAEPAIADGLDASAIRAAVIAAKPDIVIDQMTDLAAVTDIRHFDRAFATTNKLRTQGTDFLLAAAREAGVKRFIAQSFCGWTYGRGGEAIKTEADACAARCRRSSIWRKPSPARRTLKGLSCDMDHSTGRTPECSRAR